MISYLSSHFFHQSLCSLLIHAYVYVITQRKVNYLLVICINILERQFPSRVNTIAHTIGQFHTLNSYISLPINHRLKLLFCKESGLQWITLCANTLLKITLSSIFYALRPPFFMSHELMLFLCSFTHFCSSLYFHPFFFSCSCGFQ